MPMVRAEVETYRKDFLRQSRSSAVPSLMVLKKLVSSCSALPALDPAQWRAVETTRSGGMDALLNSSTMEGLDAVPSSLKQKWSMASLPTATVSPVPQHWHWLSPPPAEPTASSGPWRPALNDSGGERWQASLAGERQEQNAPTSPADHFLKLRFPLLF